MQEQKSNSNRINSALLSTLKTEIKISEDGINKKIKVLRKQQGFAITREDAALLLGSLNNVDISKFADSHKLKEIRDLKDKKCEIKQSKVKIIEKDRIINFDKNCKEIKDPLLPKKVLDDAILMSKVYAKTYIFENSVRNIIRLTMKRKFGDVWWNQVDNNIQKTVADRKKDEDNTPWMGKRGQDELCYSDVKHLKKIMEDNWVNFSFLGGQAQIFMFLDLIEKIRNIIAHHNLLEQYDIQSLDTYIGNWTRAVESNKSKIP